MAGRTIPGVQRRRSRAKDTKGHGAKNVAEDVRAEAVRLYAEVGLAEAARRTGCAKSSITRWARAAGISSDVARSAASEASRAATDVSVAKRRAVAAEARARLVEMQASIALTASAAELELLTAYRGFVASANASSLGATGAAETARLQAAMSGPRLSELVGAKTRAIHDLQLLDGQATEQPEGGLTVRFATTSPGAVLVPAPAEVPEAPAAPVFTIVELPALTQEAS